METVWDVIAPGLDSYESKFITDSILLPQLIAGQGPAFPFFRLHERLAKECCRIIVSKGTKSVPEEMDEALGALMSQTGSDTDAALLLVSPGYKMFCDMREEHPTKVFEKMRDFYRKLNPTCFELPFGDYEYGVMLKELDEKAQAALKYLEDELSFARRPAVHSEALCMHGLVQSRLFAAHDYAYAMSLPSGAFEGWRRVFDRLSSCLKRQDSELYKQTYRPFVADKTLRILFGKQIQPLNNLLGFKPLNPQKLLRGLPDPTKDIEQAVRARAEVDEKIIAIRQRAERFRHLINKVLQSCLHAEAKAAADKLDELRNMKPSHSVNRAIIDELGEFSNKRFVSTLESLLDRELRKELTRKEEILWSSRYVGHVGLVISGLTLVANFYGLAPRLNSALAGARTTLFPTAAIAEILRSGMHLLPGFDICAAFHKWPRVDVSVAQLPSRTKRPVKSLSRH